MHVPVDSSVLLAQRRLFATIVLRAEPCNQFQLAAGALAATIVDSIGSNATLWHREDAKMLKGMQGYKRAFQGEHYSATS